LATAVTDKHDFHNQTTEKVRAVANAAGASGQSTSVYFRANFVQIGGYKLDEIELRYSEDRSGAMASTAVASGLLGNRILDNFDIVIDFRDEPALYLKPNRNFNVPFEDISMYRGF
jgi:hypothetical protein